MNRLQTPPLFARRSQIFAQAAGLLVGSLGVAALIGWWLNVEALKCIVSGSTPLKPNIAAGFLLCGAGLVLLSRKKIEKWLRHVIAAVALLVIALAVSTLGETFFGWNLGIDQWLIAVAPTAASTSQRMMPTTAFCFLIAGSALLADAQLIPNRFRFPLVAGLSATLVIIGLLALGGFLLETLFGSRWNLLGMSLSGVSAAVGFMVFGSGLLAMLQSKSGLTWSLDALNTAGFAVGVLLMFVATGSAFTFAKQMLETNKSVSHQQDVLRKIQRSTTGVTDLASSERVYVIVGDERLLKDREQTKGVLEQDLGDIRKSTSDNPNQQRRLDRLEPLIAQRIDWEEQVIAARRQQNSPAASQMIATGPGLRLSDEIFGLLKEMEDQQYDLVGSARKRAETASIAMFRLLPLGVFLSLCILSLGVFFFNTGASEQKRAETSLRKSEAQLQTIVENLDEGVVVSDLDGRLLQWNRAALKLHGYSSSDQDRRCFTELIDTFELSTLDGSILPAEQWPLARVLRGEQVHDLELRVRRIGSDWERIFHYGGTLVHDAINRPLMAIVTVGDITDRKRADEMLRASEERYRRLFESNPNPMWVYDLQTLSFLAVNAAAVRHYGYSQDEFLAMTIKEIRPAEDVPALMDNLSQRTDGLDNSAQWRHRKKDGVLIDVEITSHELMWLGRSAKLVLINDVTKRKRTEEAHAQLAAIVESSDDAIISKNLEGVISSWNLGAEKLFGYSAEEAIGKSILMLFPPERIREESEIFARIRQGETVEHFETVRVRKDGKQIDVSVTLSPTRDDNGKIIGGSKIARDITERKRAEEEIRQLNAELEERVVKRTAELEIANKELEAFSYSVSHDLRSPLRTVDGFSQAVLEDYGEQLPEEGRRYLQTIREGAQRMGALIDDLLTFSRLSRLPLSKQRINPATLVRGALDELHAQQNGRKIDIRIGELPPCQGDAALLKQVWLNLLSNALKYTRNREAAIVEIGCAQDNGEAVYFVRDNGTGFDMQYVHKLFGVFQRLHRADEFEGTGVGLAIVQRVVHRHGGRVWAEATLNRGATFHFTLEEESNV